MNGMQLLNKYRAPLHRLAVFMAIDKYNLVPDVADRVGDARLALVEAASTFKAAPKREGFGYFVRYVLGQVAGAIRHGAGYAKETSAAETSFVDLSEVVVARLEEPSRLANEALWYLNNDTIASTTSVIASVIADKKRIKVALDRLADEGIEATEEQLPTILLHALTELEEREMCPVPPWTTSVPERSPAAQDLGPTYIKRLDRNTGELTVEEVSGEQFTELVNEASRSSVMWDDESMEVAYEDRSEAPRYDTNPAADNLEPEECIPPRLWAWLVQAFTTGGFADQEAALEELEEYWGDPDPDDPTLHASLSLDDPSKRKALFVLAEDIASQDCRDAWKAPIPRAVVVYGTLRKLLGLETPGGWEPPELPSGRALRGPALDWVGKLGQTCWPSQFAGIKALAFHRASPQEARVIEREVYAETRR